MDELSKIDLLRERMGVTYQQAKDALDANGGDVVQALIYLEKNSKKWDDRLDEKGRQLADYIRDIIRKGNVTKVRLKKGDKIVFEIPATIGALGVGGAILIPPLLFIVAVGTVAALVNNYSLEIVRPDGKVERHDLSFLDDDGREKQKTDKR
ncbi:MAG: DUF4342 domain-containing protein [Peptococcaceae bacterium]|jgi:N-acetylmuramic acid 6-phosphate (MurNAc-6-P) etherase|nr:DUF4342 domain-containing protein [Peptococcaceae bacterium]MDH7524554.1 DUF4342 domain-containing protein [Peptococcaceae bacterium]